MLVLHYSRCEACRSMMKFMNLDLHELDVAPPVLVLGRSEAERLVPPANANHQTRTRIEEKVNRNTCARAPARRRTTTRNRRPDARIAPRQNHEHVRRGHLRPGVLQHERQPAPRGDVRLPRQGRRRQVIELLHERPVLEEDAERVGRLAAVPGELRGITLGEVRGRVDGEAARGHLRALRARAAVEEEEEAWHEEDAEESPYELGAGVCQW